MNVEGSRGVAKIIYVEYNRDDAKKLLTELKKKFLSKDYSLPPLKGVYYTVIFITRKLRYLILSKKHMSYDISKLFSDEP